MISKDVFDTPKAMQNIFSIRSSAGTLVSSENRYVYLVIINLKMYFLSVLVLFLFIFLKYFFPYKLKMTDFKIL